MTTIMSTASCFGLFGCDDEDGEATVVKDSKTNEELMKELRDAKYCCVCKSFEIKYRCPGCQLRTCGLDCVKKHKRNFSCNGKRDRVPFVKRGDFNDKIFIDDYFLLEETEQVIERAVRVRQSICQARDQKKKTKQRKTSARR